MNMLQHNYATVCKQVLQTEQQVGRMEHSVQLIAVSKTFPAADIRQIYAVGARHFGENYVQEWYEKTHALADLSDIVWHIIGDIQSNKTKYVAERAAWVHTISRLKIAQRLNDQRPDHLSPLQVCIEVNITGEVNKHGVSPEAAVALACEVAKLPKLQVRGFMCVAQANGDDVELRQQFHTMQQLLNDLNQVGISADVLSMGMSADMLLAIECGATHVRVGSAIFGKRDYPIYQE